MKQATSVTKASSDWAAESDSKTEPDSVATSDGEKSALPWPTFIQMVSPDILLAEAHLIERKKVLKERLHNQKAKALVLPSVLLGI